jgi:hypothetical protein
MYIHTKHTNIHVYTLTKYRERERKRERERERERETYEGFRCGLHICIYRERGERERERPARGFGADCIHVCV